jgi:hypothetical protein
MWAAVVVTDLLLFFWVLGVLNLGVEGDYASALGI